MLQLFSYLQKDISERLTHAQPVWFILTLIYLWKESSLNAMRAVRALLLIFPIAVLGHVHVSGVPVAPGEAYRRLFDPVDPNFCNAQPSPISCLKNNPQGTPYCSSYISIPTATV